MRNTTKYALTVPSSNTDPDDVPTHLGGFGDQVDGLLSKHTSGTLAARPAAGIKDQYYFVNSGSGTGILWHDTGTAWEQVNAAAGVVANVTTMGYGDAPAIGTATAFAPADHRHGSQTNPVTPHVAASDPHPQYAMDVTDTGWLDLTSYLSGWSVATGHIAQARMIGNRVNFRGALLNSTLSGAFSAACSLPASIPPPPSPVSGETFVFPIGTTSSYVRVMQLTQGSSVIQFYSSGASGTFFYLNGVSYLTN